jgi:hypothetical protein
MNFLSQLFVALIVILIGLLLKDVYNKKKESDAKKNDERVNDGDASLSSQKLETDDQEDGDEKVEHISFITPKEFNAGAVLDKNGIYPSINGCDHNTLYPLNFPYVDYGSKFPDCRCTDFVQPP